MLIENPPLALTFDDVLLVPRHSTVLPHETVVTTALGPLSLAIPLLSAAMDTVTELPMARAMGRLGGLGVLHKNVEAATQVSWVRAMKEEGLLCAAAIGVGDPGRTDALVAAGVDLLVLDTAHGHSQGVLQRAREIRDRHPDVVLSVGNVATPEAVHAAADHGAHIVKVGVGPGSICTTRIVAGVGVPQLTAVGACALAARERGISLIADGGIRTSGDVAKAIAAGAHAVMLGSLFAGTDEAPGEVIQVDGAAHKSYRGMGSLDAMLAGSSDRYFQSTHRKLVAEGVVASVACKGPLDDIVGQLIGGLRASLGYCGCADLAQMAADARFVRITSAGLHESHVHDVRVR